MAEQLDIAAELAKGAHAVGVELSRQRIGRIIKYLELLIKWNERINLVGTHDAGEIVRRHVVDSLAVLPHIPPGSQRVIDVGSGAGLPGAVIAIARPDVVVVALEPVHKKHAYLMTVRRDVPAPNLDPRPIRIEDLPASDRSFDVAVSRATFAIDEWLAKGLEVVRTGGCVLGMEGAEEMALPEGATRHRYKLDDRTRAIIRLVRST